MPMEEQAAIVLIFTLSLPWASIDSAVLPTARYLNNGENWICLNRTEKQECPFDHEIAKCSTNNTLVECRPCRHGYRNCVRASSLRDVKCYRPELDCEPDERFVVKELSDGGCDTRCVCLQEGYVKDANGECVKREKCATDMMLIDDRCSKCPVGSYKPWVGDGGCIPIPTNQIPSSTTTPSQELDNSTQEVNQTKITKDQAEITVTDVQALSSTEVYLQWKRPGNMCNYTVVYQPESLDPAEEKKKNVFNKDAIVNMTLQELRPATNYKAYIMASDSKQQIKSPDFRVKTKEDEEFDVGGTSNTSDGIIACVVIGICSFLLLSLFIIGYLYRKCKKRREPTRGEVIPDALGDPPPYEEAVHNNDELNNVLDEGEDHDGEEEDEEEGVGHDGEEGEEQDEEGHEGDPPPPPAGDRDLIPGPEFSTISSAMSYQPISNDPDETNLKERHSAGSTPSNERVSLSSNEGVFRRGSPKSMPRRINSSTALLPRFDSQSPVLPPEPESERPLVTDPLIPPDQLIPSKRVSGGRPAVANYGQSSIDLANQGISSVNLRSPRRDSTSSQTFRKKKPGGFVDVPISSDNHDLNTNTDLKRDNPM